MCLAVFRGTQSAYAERTTTASAEDGLESSAGPPGTMTAAHNDGMPQGDRMRLALIFFLIQMMIPAFAKPVMTATCDEPVGNRIDQVGGKIQRREDGFTGVNPVFILDDEKPGKLLYIWGPAKWARDSGVETKALEASIVSVTGDKLTAVRVDDHTFGVVHMYSLYPAKGLVFFTQHRHLNVDGGVPSSATYHARCKFAG